MSFDRTRRELASYAYRSGWDAAIAFGELEVDRLVEERRAVLAQAGVSVSSPDALGRQIQALGAFGVTWEMARTSSGYRVVIDTVTAFNESLPEALAVATELYRTKIA